MCNSVVFRIDFLSDDFHWQINFFSYKMKNLWMTGIIFMFQWESRYCTTFGRWWHGRNNETGLEMRLHLRSVDISPIQRWGLKRVYCVDFVLFYFFISPDASKLIPKIELKFLLHHWKMLWYKSIILDNDFLRKKFAIHQYIF